MGNIEAKQFTMKTFRQSFYRRQRELSGFVRKVVSGKVELVATDENPSYKHLGLPHEAVEHSAGEYVRGKVTQTRLNRSGHC
jgi:hypothetical protein